MFFHVAPEDMYVMGVVASVFTIFTGIEVVRYQRHLARLKEIPHRVHINGARGKSSTTRILGGALRRGGKPVITKTTGTMPRFIFPDGHEIPIFRAGKPNIIEQLKVVKKAHELDAHILIAECMAVTPEYISCLEDRVIKGTLGIITNVREDHLDVMGPTVYDVAVNLCRSLPRNGMAFTAEKKWFSVMQEEARKRGTKLIQCDPDGITDEEMEGFSYIEHKENVCIALATAEYYGIDRKTAFLGMYEAEPDPGVLREYTVNRKDGTFYFFNALAANDPDSSTMIWNNAIKKRPVTSLALLILRPDRVQRTESFVQILGEKLKADYYVIAGSPVSFAAEKLRSIGVSEDRIIALEEPEPQTVVDAMMAHISGGAVAVAMGNIVGLGTNVVNLFEEQSKTGVLE